MLVTINKHLQFYVKLSLSLPANMQNNRAIIQFHLIELSHFTQTKCLIGFTNNVERTNELINETRKILQANNKMTAIACHAQA